MTARSSGPRGKITIELDLDKDEDAVIEDAIWKANKEIERVILQEKGMSDTQEPYLRQLQRKFTDIQIKIMKAKQEKGLL